MASEKVNVFNTKIANSVIDLGIKALNNTAEKLLNDEIIGITPKLTGKLRSSLKIEKANKGNKKMKIISKGSIAPYNSIRHEKRTIRYTTPGTDFKFLENPFRNNAENVFKEEYVKELKSNGY